MRKKSRKKLESQARHEALDLFVKKFFKYNADERIYVLKSSSGTIAAIYVEDVCDFIADHGRIPHLSDLA